MPVSATLLGITTLLWGTPAGVAPVSGAIVKSARVTTYGGKVGNIENGIGSDVTTVLLDGGFDAEIACEYDSSKTWPELGDVVSLTLPGGAATECLVINNPVNEFNLNRKQAGEIVVKVEYRPDINYTP
jgi:hypothetical protein